jgi:GntR family transcriptional repressor for pyruvate dehydrogenase complex
MNQIFPKPVLQSLPDQVAGMIMQRIASGELGSGQKLPPQRQLAQSMGVSLAVVREAVKRLEALNVLDAAHGSGTVVRSIRWTPFLYDPSLFAMAMQNIDIKHLWETRRLLEGQIVRLAAERAKPHHIEEIRAVLDRADPLPLDYNVSSDLNREFHIAVAKAAQNNVLVELLTPLVDVHFQNISHHFTEDVCRRTWAAHEAIFRAVSRHDVAAAERAMREHFTVGPIAVETDTDGTKGSRKKAKAPARRRR